jgi:hypothetical protein
LLQGGLALIKVPTPEIIIETGSRIGMVSSSGTDNGEGVESLLRFFLKIKETVT